MDILELTKRLLEYRSISYHELRLVEYISTYLSERAIPHIIDRYHPTEFLGDFDPGIETANIYVDVGDGPETLLLYAHTDVVEGGDEQFAPRLEDDRLIGRGAADMKAALAGLMLLAVDRYEAVRRSGKRVIFSFIADEERSGTGARQQLKWLQQQGLDPDHLWCVLTEPTDDFSEIDIGGKGYIFLDVEGDLRAIIDVGKAILATRERIVADYMPQDDRFGLPLITLTTIHCEGDRINKQGISVHGVAAHASRPHEGSNALEWTLSNLSTPVSFLSTGNNSPNTIPDWCVVQPAFSYPPRQCKATIDIRTNPEADREDGLLDDLGDILSSVEGVRWSIRDRGKAYHTENPHLLGLLQASTTRPPVPGISMAGSDAGYYASFTRNVIGGFGPGERRLIHTDNEAIEVAVLKEVVDVFASILDGFISA